MNSPEGPNIRPRLRTPALETTATNPTQKQMWQILTIRVAEKGLNLDLGTASESRGTYFRKLSKWLISFKPWLLGE